MSDIHHINLAELSGANAFNLQGIVAVITGGASVRCVPLELSHCALHPIHSFRRCRVLVL